MSPEIVFTLFYLLLSACIIYPPTEFATAGLTISDIFSSLLGSEDEQFILYNIKRSTLSVLIYSLLPIGYVLGCWLFIYDEDTALLVLYERSLFWKIFFTSSIVFPLVALYYINDWVRNNWSSHPIVVHLSKFSNNNNGWQDVASSINTEFRRVEKICLQLNAITKIVATENWIVKVTPLMLCIAHQSDASLIVNQADTHHISVQNSSEVQYVTIEVKSSRTGVNPFTIRINALDFKDLQDRVARTITVLPTVKFHKTVVEQFVDAFKEAAKNNQLYATDQELEQCIGCLQSAPNVKIQRLCATDEQSPEECGTCYCRPMWCVDCLAKWFASRQNPEQPYTWLASKCTCPMCRARFCILDVCLTTNSA